MCRDALKNVKLTQTLVDVICEAGATGGCPKAQGNLLVVVATKVSTCTCSAPLLRRGCCSTPLLWLWRAPGGVA